jgi:hypothetical protein
MSTPVNLAAVHAMGSQFTDNVFEKINKKAVKVGTKLNRAAVPKSNIKPPTPVYGTTVTAGTPTKNAPGNTLSSGGPSAAGLGGGTAPKAISAGVPTPFTPGATPHSNTGPNRLAIGSGRQPIATPYQAPTRVIPMSSNAALTNRVNPSTSFSDASVNTPVNRTAFNQPSTNPFQINTMQPSSPAKATPTVAKTSPVTPQFADVSTKDNSPFPTHVHPTGSSNQILPRLSAAQSRPSAPNSFTVGSRNIKSSGIAAMGSQLEAGLTARPLGLPQPRKRV